MHAVGADRVSGARAAIVTVAVGGAVARLRVRIRAGAAHHCGRNFQFIPFLCTGYRGACVWGAWARNVSIDRGTRRLVSEEGRGIRTVRRVRITDPTPQAGVVHARDTWQHTTRPLHGNSPSPLQPKTKLLDVRARTSRPRAIMQTRRGAQKRGRALAA